MIHDTVKGRYGSPRVHAELTASAAPCCVNTVAKLMRTHGIAAKTARKFRHTTDSNHDLPVAANHLERAFDFAAANEAWVSDFTFIPTRKLLALPRGRRGPVLAAGRGLGDERPHDDVVGCRCVGDGGRVPLAWAKGCCRTRIEAVSTPVNITVACWPSTGSYAA